MKIQTAYEECFYYTFPSQSPVSFLSAGITYPIGSYDYSRKLSNCYSIEYIYRGSGFLNQGYSNIPLEAGDMFLLHPGVPCRYYAESSWKKIWVSLENPGPFIDHLISDYNLKQCNVLKRVQSPIYLEEIFHLVKSRQPNVHHRLELLLHMQISKMAQFYQSTDEDLAPSPLEKAINYIETYLNTKITLEDLSKNCGIGKKQLTLLFRESFQTTPIAYCNMRKIQEACYLLQNTELPIHEIADLYNFDNVNYFSRVFLKYTNMTPYAYRAAPLEKNSPKRQKNNM